MKKVLLVFLFLFNILLFVSCSQADDYKLTVVAPQGAPAVAVASAAIGNEDNYAFINANNISEQFTANEKDIIIAPVNAGAKLYKAGKSTYKLGAVVTWGNLYFASQKSLSSISDLEGEKVILFGENTINSSLAKFVLEKKNINVTYEYKGSAEDTKNLLVSDANAIVMTAEPALTAVSNQLKQKNVTVSSFSISELYKEVSDSSEYTQAGLFIKVETIENHKKALNSFLDTIKSSCDLVTSDVDKVAENIISLGNTGLPSAAAVLKTALPKCNIKYVSASDAKTAVEKTVEIDKTQFGGANPSDDFYYNK